jgi:small subunit ribosomal protein S6
MRVYELIYILKPDLPEEEANGAVEQFKSVITDGGAQIDKLDIWGKRRLAYEVRNYTDGFYVFVQYSIEGGAKLAKEVERRLRVADSVIKFMTVRIDEDLKRIDKLKQKREKRAARKPQSGAPGPAEPRARAKSEVEAPKVPEQPAAEAEGTAIPKPQQEIS